MPPRRGELASLRRENERLRRENQRLEVIVSSLVSAMGELRRQAARPPPPPANAFLSSALTTAALRVVLGEHFAPAETAELRREVDFLRAQREVQMRHLDRALDGEAESRDLLARRLRMDRWHAEGRAPLPDQMFDSWYNETVVIFERRRYRNDALEEWADDGLGFLRCVTEPETDDESVPDGE